MDTIFNEIFTHVVKNEVAELVSLPEFIDLTQENNPVSNTPEFMKLMLTLESVIKTSSHLVRISNLEEKNAAEKLEQHRQELFGSSSEESDSLLSQMSSEFYDDGGNYVCDLGPDPDMKLAKYAESADSTDSSRTQDVFFMDHHGETINERLNRVFLEFFINSCTVSLIASDVNRDFTVVDESQRGSYVLYFNPLDSAYNVYYGTSCGAFFSFVKKVDYMFKPSMAKEHALLSGQNIDCAGYVIYGCTTVLTIAIRNGGVHQFTLDSNLGMFIRTASNIQTPLKGKTYTITESSSMKWNAAVAAFIYKKKEEEEIFDYYQPGSMVSVLHYVLREGGIFIDPALHISQDGQTSLLFTANPVAFVLKESGGSCFNGADLKEILDINPESLHQTTPIFGGSNDDVDELKELFIDYSQEIL